MLYGNVNTSEQRPTESQLSRMTVLAKDVAGKRTKFEESLKALTPLNQELEKRKLAPVRPAAGEDGQKKTAA